MAFAAALCLVGATGPAMARYAAIVVEADTGRVLFEKNADAPRYPASITKIMTLYLVFEALDARKVTLNTRLKVSGYAAQRPPSKVGLKPGATITVEQAIYALVTKSANDVASVVAENLGGSEPQFARMMTHRARRLGMLNTTFRNASGLPDKGQVTTARDFTIMARAMLRDHPRYYRYFSTRGFDFRGHHYHNHNRLLDEFDGLDGIKTGFINASGFNLVASAKRNGRRLIGVVMGGETSRGRDAHMAELLEAGFATPRPQLPPVREARAPAPVLASATEPLKLEARGPAPSLGPSLSQIIAVIERPRLIATAEAADGNEGSTDEPEPAAAPRPAKRVAVAAIPPGPKPGAARRAAPAATAERAAAWSGGREDWSIQVGAFSRKSSASRAIKNAQKKLPTLADASPMVAEVDKNLFRARLVGLDERAARAACTRLGPSTFPCAVIPPGRDSLAAVD